MKKLLGTLVAALVLFALSSAAFADEMNNMHAANHMMAGGKKVTLTGNLVDLSCYIGSGFHGASHKACAKACALNGGAFGIETADGNIVTVFGSGPSDKPNQKLLPYLEDKVTVTGEEFKGHGITGIRIDTISAAK
ncbi:MAG TPA: hypothetical protein VGQ96_04110 [Candidatus Eremiobacteraceae bacterium]|nr:hypothetical protein [Candidatus Eremiobacteraceae bacterium]